jgi:phosphatidate phosphatase APP1
MWIERADSDGNFIVHAVEEVPQSAGRHGYGISDIGDIDPPRHA